MILYNVTVKIEPEIKEEWLQWMKSKHIPEVMATGNFTHYRLCRLLEQNDEEEITYVIQYLCNSAAHYNRYIEHHAPLLQKKHHEKFKNHFVAFRTVMEVLD